MRLDRKSAYEQFDLPFNEAMANEFNLGSQVLKKESVQGK